MNKNIVTNIFQYPIFARTIVKTQGADWLSLQKASSSLLSPETASVDVSIKILRDVHAQQLTESERCPFVNVYLQILVNLPGCLLPPRWIWRDGQGSWPNPELWALPGRMYLWPDDNQVIIFLIYDLILSSNRILKGTKWLLCLSNLWIWETPELIQGWHYSLGLCRGTVPPGFAHLSSESSCSCSGVLLVSVWPGMTRTRQAAPACGQKGNRNSCMTESNQLCCYVVRHALFEKQLFFK